MLEFVLRTLSRLAMSEIETNEYRLKLVRHWLGLTLFMLVAATWPLWTTGRELPTLPALGVLVAVPGWVDFVLLGALVLATLYAGWRGRGTMWVGGFLAALMLLDQLRWQAWAWHAMLATLVICSGPVRWRLPVLRAITIAIYVYSAISKFDIAFATTLGQQFLDVLLSPFDADSTAFAWWLRVTLALLFPFIELTVAMLLALPRTRKIGVVLATFMHIGLAAILSPLGLDHSLGVVLWNLLFAMLTLLLFAPSAWLLRLPVVSAAIEEKRGPVLPLLAAAAIGIVAPSLGLVDRWDPWPSWALYAPRREQVAFSIPHDKISLLPKSLQRVSTHSHLVNRREPIDIEVWCLAETGAPLYPGIRVPLALAKWLNDENGWMTQLHCVVRGSADVFTGQRSMQRVWTSSEFRERLSKSWLNTRVRDK